MGALFALLFGFVGSLLGGMAGRAIMAVIGASLAVTAVTESGLENTPSRGRVKLILATVCGAALGAGASLALPRGLVGSGELIGGLLAGGGATLGFNGALLVDPEITTRATVGHKPCELSQMVDGRA